MNIYIHMINVYRFLDLVPNIGKIYGIINMHSSISFFVFVDYVLCIDRTEPSKMTDVTIMM